MIKRIVGTLILVASLGVMALVVMNHQKITSLLPKGGSEAVMSAPAPAAEPVVPPTTEGAAGEIAGEIATDPATEQAAENDTQSGEVAPTEP